MIDRLTVSQSVILGLVLVCFIAATYVLDERKNMSDNVIAFRKGPRDGDQDAACGVGLSNITINIIAAIGAGLIGWLVFYLVMPS